MGFRIANLNPFGSQKTGLDAVFGNRKLAPQINDLTQYGTDLGGAGGTTGAGAIAGINQDIGGWEDQLHSGNVLPDSVNRAYDTLRGQIGDEQSRSVNAVRAGIAQRRAQSGGLMSDAAGEEFNRLGANDINDNAFTAIGNVGVNQAQTQYGATRDLMDRVSAARNNILNYGEFQQQLGLNARAQGLGLNIDRNKAIVGSVLKGFGR